MAAMTSVSSLGCFLHESSTSLAVFVKSWMFVGLLAVSRGLSCWLLPLMIALIRILSETFALEASFLIDTI